MSTLRVLLSLFALLIVAACSEDNSVPANMGGGGGGGPQPNYSSGSPNVPSPSASQSTSSSSSQQTATPKPVAPKPVEVKAESKPAPPPAPSIHCASIAESAMGKISDAERTTILFACIRQRDEFGFGKVMDFVKSEAKKGGNSEWLANAREANTNYNLLMVAVESGKPEFADALDEYISPLQREQVWDTSPEDSTKSILRAMSAYDLALKAYHFGELAEKWRTNFGLFEAGYYGETETVFKILSKQVAETGKPLGQVVNQRLSGKVNLDPKRPDDSRLTDLYAQKLTLLHLAAWQGHYDLASRLIDNGAVPEITDAFGSTPLHYLSWSGTHWGYVHYAPVFRQGELADLLLSKGNPLWLTNRWNELPLSDASFYLRTHLTESRGYDTRAFTKATSAKTDVDHLNQIISELRAGTVDAINRQNAQDQTALHIALAIRDVPSIRYLLLHFPRVDLADKDGNLPIHIAAKVGIDDKAILNYLGATTYQDQKFFVAAPDATSIALFLQERGEYPRLRMIRESKFSLVDGTKLYEMRNGQQEWATDEKKAYEALLPRWTKPADEKNKLGQSILFLAGATNSEENVNQMYFLTSPEYRNQVDADGNTILHIALLRLTQAPGLLTRLLKVNLAMLQYDSGKPTEIMDPFIRNRHKLTPKELAERLGLSAVIPALEGYERVFRAAQARK
jgi:ankyrin repeat protein